MAARTTKLSDWNEKLELDTHCKSVNKLVFLSFMAAHLIQYAFYCACISQEVLLQVPISEHSIAEWCYCDIIETSSLNDCLWFPYWWKQNCPRMSIHLKKKNTSNPLQSRFKKHSSVVAIVQIYPVN